MQNVSEALKLVFAGGLGLVIAAVVNAYRTIRDTNSRSQGTVLVRWREYVDRLQNELNEKDADLDYQSSLHDYWRLRAGDLEYALRSKGVEVPPRGPLPNKREVQKPRRPDVNGDGHARRRGK